MLSEKDLLLGRKIVTIIFYDFIIQNNNRHLIFQKKAFLGFIQYLFIEEVHQITGETTPYKQMVSNVGDKKLKQTNTIVRGMGSEATEMISEMIEVVL